MADLTPTDIDISLRLIYPRLTAKTEALANDLGVNKKTVQRWVKGERDPSKFLFDYLAWRVAGQMFWNIASNLSYDNLPESTNFAVYASEKELKDITGEPWNYVFHAKIMKCLSAMIEGIGIGCALVTIDAPGYFEWLGDRENTPAMRSFYAAVMANKMN